MSVDEKGTTGSAGEVAGGGSGGEGEMDVEPPDAPIHGVKAKRDKNS
jgi:hypothetical protein